MTPGAPARNGTGTELPLVNASTGGTGAVTYTFAIDGVNFGAPDSAIASRTWYTALMDNGNHTITVVAHDSGGHTAQAQRIVATANIGDDPTLMLNAPVPAAKKVLEKAGLTKDDIDLWEIN